MRTGAAFRVLRSPTARGWRTSRSHAGGRRKRARWVRRSRTRWPR